MTTIDLTRGGILYHSSYRKIQKLLHVEEKNPQKMMVSNSLKVIFFSNHIVKSSPNDMCILGILS